MLEKIRTIFTIPELRQKILLTLGLLAIYRVGWWVPLPIVNPDAMRRFAEEAGGFGDVLKTVAVFSASQLTQATIFGLGIMPYISASIIFQLLGTVWPPLERLTKEGESGRKRINEYTRYATVIICIVQSWAYVAFLANTRVGQESLIQPAFLVDGKLPFIWQFVAVMTMTAGTIFLMWLGEQIDEFGIGNGISLLIMAGILAAMPSALLDLRENSSWELGGGGGKLGVDKILLLIAMFIAVVAGVHDAGSAADPHPVGQARPRSPRLRGHQAVPAPEGEPGRGDADHLRQFAAAVPADPAADALPGLPRQCRAGRVARFVHPRAVVHLQPAVRRPDLLLLLLLDRHLLQSQGGG
jgi:preprotein translocase subunit SecY